MWLVKRYIQDDLSALLLKDDIIGEAHVFNTKAYTFNNFIVSDCNEKAYNTCVSIVDDAKGRFVVLCGPSGCGKTHLMTATRNAYKQKYPDKSVLVMSANELIERYIDSFEHQKTAEYVDMICSQDLLVVDNMQFMSGRLSVQEEVAKWFCKIIEDGKSIIGALDVQLDEFGGAFRTMDEQHTGQCQIINIHEPDIVLRQKYLGHLIKNTKINVPKSVLSILIHSEQIALGSFSGILQKFMLLQSQTNRKLTKQEMIDCIFEYL